MVGKPKMHGTMGGYILPGTMRTNNNRQRRLVRGDLPLRTFRRGCGKSGHTTERPDWTGK